MANHFVTEMSEGSDPANIKKMRVSDFSINVSHYVVDEMNTVCYKASQGDRNYRKRLAVSFKNKVAQISTNKLKLDIYNNLEIPKVGWVKIDRYIKIHDYDYVYIYSNNNVLELDFQKNKWGEQWQQLE